MEGFGRDVDWMGIRSNEGISMVLKEFRGRDVSTVTGEPGKCVRGLWFVVGVNSIGNWFRDRSFWVWGSLALEEFSDGESCGGA